MIFSGLFAGLTTIDIQYFVDNFPAPNKKVKTNAPDLLVGGPATNAAVAFAHLNGGANLAGATGKNAFSSFIEDDFKENHIHFYNINPSENSNPVLASVITSGINGDRTIFTHHPGPVASEIPFDELFNKVRPQILLLDGFYAEAFGEIALIAKSKKVPVVLDCGSWKTQYEQLIPIADIAICSEDFAPPGCDNLIDVVDFLHDHGIRKSAISRGEKNLVFCNGRNRGEVPVEKTNITDSLGAGDFLHGAFCFYYLQMNFHFEDALRQAVKFATFTCKYKGTRSWIKKFKHT